MAEVDTSAEVVKERIAVNRQIVDDARNDRLGLTLLRTTDILEAVYAQRDSALAELAETRRQMSAMEEDRNYWRGVQIDTH